MAFLNGINLGARQQQINEKVKSAVLSNADFEKLKSEPENSDVDTIFKIDLAVKYKDIDYILKVLKSGDAFAISRALNKCIWLCENEFANVINSEFLLRNVFPSMSIKMKKRTLNTISMYLKDENRILEFYKFCLETKLENIASKFLIFAPESFKMEVVNEKSNAFNFISNKEGVYLKHYVGSSFTLAECYLKNLTYARERSNALYELRGLYSVSQEQYLDLLDIYEDAETKHEQSRRYGLRLSRDIIKNHKKRMLDNPSVYIHILNTNIIQKYSTVAEAKFYAMTVLPKEVSTFWKSRYHETYKYILDLIPADEKFSFLKQIFHEKYQNEKFEFNVDFHTYKFYNLMTVQEKEVWALKQIAGGEEVLGIGNDYTWYKFVTFDKAFVEIKRLITITTNNDKRWQMLKILIYSAKTQGDLEQLLNHYYKRHVNESKYDKECFLNELIDQHNDLIFDKDCWLALEKIFYSIDVFNKLHNFNTEYNKYRTLALIYYVIYIKKIPNNLQDCIDLGGINFNYLERYGHQLDLEKKEMVYKYLIQYYLDKVKTLKEQQFSDKIKCDIYKYIDYAIDMTSKFKKTKDSIPEIMFEYIRSDFERFKCNVLFTDKNKYQLTEGHMVRYLKTDADLIMTKFPQIRDYFENRYGNINWLLKKLKSYFAHDIGVKFLKNLKECISGNEVCFAAVKVAVRGIIILENESDKAKFLEMYKPEHPKIDHINIHQNMLYIQQGICCQMCYARPPLPLSSIFLYLTGDYVHFCLPVFNHYLMNLTLPLCLKFVESLIDKPLSIQKHGLRLAFECFNPEDLKAIVYNCWKRAKNFTLRKILYKALLNKISTDKNDQLFEILKDFTEELQEDDDNEIFNLVCGGYIPDKLIGQFLAAGWQVVKKFTDRSVNIERKTNLLMKIEHKMYQFPEDILNSITDDHIRKMLDEKNILETEEPPTQKGLKEMLKLKWKLTARNTCYHIRKDQLLRNLEVVKHIIKKCMEMWSEVRHGKYVLREFCVGFIEDVETYSYDNDVQCFSDSNVITETILHDLNETLSEPETYMLNWNLRLSIAARNIIIDALQTETFNTWDDDVANKCIATSLKDCLLKFANVFGNMMKEYSEKKQYYSSFDDQIYSVITDKMSTIKMCLYTNNALNTSTMLNVSVADMYVLFCTGLVKFEIPKMYMFMVKTLPVEYSDINLAEYKSVMKTIKLFPYDEVQYYMYERFVNSGFKCFVDSL